MRLSFTELDNISDSEDVELSSADLRRRMLRRHINRNRWLLTTMQCYAKNDTRRAKRAQRTNHATKTKNLLSTFGGYYPI